MAREVTLRCPQFHRCSLANAMRLGDFLDFDPADGPVSVPIKYPQCPPSREESEGKRKGIRVIRLQQIEE